MVDIQTTPEASTAEGRRQAQIAEYSKYVAAQEITINGVLAFGKGFPVPISHTEEYPQLLEEDESGNVPVITVEEYTERESASSNRSLSPEERVYPSPQAGRSVWVAFAKDMGADDDDPELATVANGGLGRNELAAKYGPPEKKGAKKQAAPKKTTEPGT
jgi:hypothetical protein